MKRIVALLLVIACLCASSTALCARDVPISYLIRFIPTLIKVGDEIVTVEGYFVNLNEDVTVKNFREFELSIYKNDNLISKGDFGTLSTFSISPLRTHKHTFNFHGKHGLQIGTYSCDEKYSATFSCKFSYVED